MGILKKALIYKHNKIEKKKSKESFFLFKYFNMNAGEIVYLSSDDEEKYMQQSDDDEIYEIKNEIKEPVVHEEILLEDSEEDDDDGFDSMKLMSMKHGQNFL